MSSAANHMKRSHRSQRAHYNASNRIHYKRVAKQAGRAAMRESLLRRFIRRFRTGTPEGK